MKTYKDSQVTSSLVNRNMYGFTLIELMVVVFIIAVLAAIAMPSYRVFVIHNAESEAQSAVQNQAIKLKQWRAKSLSYRGYPQHEVFVPAGSGSDYRYKITVVDGQDPTKSLNTTVIKDGEEEFDIKGQTWMILAEPNPTGRFKNANVYFANNKGERCYVEHSKASDLVLNKTTNCSGKESW